MMREILFIRLTTYLDDVCTVCSSDKGVQRYKVMGVWRKEYFSNIIPYVINKEYPLCPKCIQDLYDESSWIEESIRMQRLL